MKNEEDKFLKGTLNFFCRFFLFKKNTQKTKKNETKNLENLVFKSKLLVVYN